MKKVVIEYYNDQDELLIEEDKEIKEGSYLDTIIGIASDPFDNPYYFSNEVMHEMDDEPISVDYVIVRNT